MISRRFIQFCDAENQPTPVGTLSAGVAVRSVTGPSIPGAATWCAHVWDVDSTVSLPEVPSARDLAQCGIATVWVGHAAGTTDPVSSPIFEVPAGMIAGPTLVVTDVDSTLICEEVIEELAERAGTREEVAAVTARAMNGELDFAQSLHARVATLAGVSAAVFDEVLAEITPTPGAQQLVDFVHSRGGRFGVVSGGFAEVVEPLGQRMGIDFCAANRLELSGGVLTGRVLGEIVTSAVKVARVKEWSALLGAQPTLVMAVGDGANDIPMLRTAGLGVAFCAKPAVQEQVDVQLNVARLDALTAVWL